MLSIIRLYKYTIHEEKKLSAIKISTLAAMLMLTGANGLAQASTYAVSYDTISNFSLVFGGGAGNLSPFTFSTNVAAQGNVVDANFGTVDAAAACVGGFCSAFNNSFSAHGAAGDYAYGDALIGNGNVQSGNASASSIGEISGSAGFASGTNSMIANFLVTTPGTVSFAFNAQPYMQVLAGGSAFSTMTITIFGAAGQVFSWAPNGVVGSGISGGVETLDSQNLNLAIASGVTYNPGAGSFAAMTNNLATGAYTLNISMSNQVSAVPEADAWAMLLAGLGLVGLRARQKAKASAALS